MPCLPNMHVHYVIKFNWGTITNTKKTPENIIFRFTLLPPNFFFCISFNIKTSRDETIRSYFGRKQNCVNQAVAVLQVLEAEPSAWELHSRRDTPYCWGWGTTALTVLYILSHGLWRDITVFPSHRSDSLSQCGAAFLHQPPKQLGPQSSATAVPAPRCSPRKGVESHSMSFHSGWPFTFDLSEWALVSSSMSLWFFYFPWHSRCYFPVTVIRWTFPSSPQFPCLP